MPVAPRLSLEALEGRVVPATHTWVDGPNNNNWSDATNWDANGPPTSNEPGGTIVVLGVEDSSVQDIPNLTIDQLQFTDPFGVLLALNQPLAFNGSPLGNIVSNNVGNSNLTNIFGPGAISFVNAAGTITTDDELGILAPITGTQDIQKTGASRLTLNTPTSSFTGNLFVNAGTLRTFSPAVGLNPTTSSLGNPQTAGRTISVAAGATLTFGNSDVFGNTDSDPAVELLIAGTVDNENNVTTTLGPVTLTGGTITAPSGVSPASQAWNMRGTVTVAGSLPSTLASPGPDTGFHLGPTTTFIVGDATGTPAPDLVVSGVLLDQVGGAAAPLTVAGAGTLALNGANTYTGLTTVLGSLEVNGSITSAVTVSLDGLLGGSGTVAAPVTALGLSFVAPGNAAAPGTLNTQNLQLLPQSTYEVRVGGTAAGQFDALNVTGTVDVSGSTLSIPVGAALLTTNQSVIIIANDGNDAVTGTFNGIPQDGTVVAANGRQFRVSYTAGDGNDVALIGVTPPDTAPPVATLESAPAVDIMNNAATYSFTVRYRDLVAVDGSSFGADIDVLTPDGTTLIGTATATAQPNVGDIGVTYTLVRANKWLTTEKGNFILRLKPNEVRDTSGNFAAAGDLGTFEVCVRDVLPSELIVTYALGVTPFNPRSTPEVFVGDATFSPFANRLITTNGAYARQAEPLSVFDGVTKRGVVGSSVENVEVDGGRKQEVDIPVFGQLPAEVQVASGDVNGDGVTDWVAGAVSGSSRVLVISGADRSTLASFSVFGDYSEGVFVAVGDLDRDGKADIAVTGAPRDAFNGPQSNGLQVRVFSGSSMVGGTDKPTVMADFNGLASLDGQQGEGPNVRLGGRVAIGDVSGDGLPDLLIAAGNGGGPRICIWDGPSVAAANGGKPTKNPIANLFVFEDTQRGGAFIAAGHVNDDCFADIIVGGGPGGGPRVRIISGKVLFNKVLVSNLEGVNLDDRANLDNGLVLSNFFAFGSGERGGVRVTTRDMDGDKFADVVVGQGYGAVESNPDLRLPSKAAVKVYKGAKLNLTQSEPSDFQEIPFASNATDGVYVG